MKRNIFCIIAIALLAVIGCSGGKFSPPSIPGIGPIFPGSVSPGDTVQNVQHGEKIGTEFSTAARLSEDDEDDLGQSVAIAVTNRYKVLRNDALTKYVTLVGLTVANSSQRNDIEYVFGVLDTNEVNAFSGPNGYVFITKGALANMQDEAELAGVLAHEESHVILHHGLAQVKDAENQAAISDLVKASPLTRFSSYADLTVDAILKNGYTKPQEIDADSAAVDLIYHTGYNPGSYLNFLQRLAALQAGKGAGGIMSTHPGTSERVDNVKHILMNISSIGATLPDRFHKNVKF
jgi:predicted Zn-dependent protease